jgi:DNA-directed RNA polymerase subunit K/omega
MSDPIASPNLNIEKAARMVGGSRFELSLIASQRAREIESERRIAGRNNPDKRWETTSTTAALQEVEEGSYTREDYINSISGKK